MVNAQFKRNTIITTDRLLIRPLQLEDADHIFGMRFDRDAYKWTMAGQWHEKSQALDWVESALASDDNYNFVVELLAHDMSSGLQDSNPSDANKTAEPVVIGSMGIMPHHQLGYMFYKDYWGKGYASEALNAFVSKAFEELPEVEKLTAKVDSENYGSLGVMRKCGFTEVARVPYVNATMGDRTEVQFEIGRTK
ncbi:uncharacterized protein PV09_01065 [Verruconis gallopava]|uniref:N-acetyltransferase domain-containing protein n=1 Tax=Verruconis gallopava TaxID=253628 RepID=A0A0D1XZA0_9PEZI|nr:uncharacterized protein PV09_01065 [Verruconis gallopava]KIW08131.1 hypothetical protein PV09_01065 [Verruconis gallopava]